MYNKADYYFITNRTTATMAMGNFYYVGCGTITCLTSITLSYS